jgi:hypothetical protein
MIVALHKNLNEDIRMQSQRRQFLKGFAGVGAMGAASLAMGVLGQQQARAAQSAPSYGQGDALKGPYLDLSTGRGNQLAYARLQSDIDFGQQKYFWFKGYVMGVRPNKRVNDLFGAQGFGVIRLKEREDGSFERLCREIILYTDLNTNEVLEEWKNPFIQETVKVVQVDNDPFNYLIADHFPPPPSFGGLNKEKAPPKIPFVLPWTQRGDWLEMEMHIHLAYPNALQPEEWPRESSGKVARVSEMFAHHVKAADMQNPDITSLDYLGTWNRITPWLPWMYMGQADGGCQYNCFMGTADHPGDVLPKPVMDYAEKHYAKYFEAPTEWSDESLSSLERYAQTQKPAPGRSD